MTHVLKHNDLISFPYHDPYQTLPPTATYRVHSAISDALNMNNDPVFVAEQAAGRETVWLVRVVAAQGVPVTHGDRVSLEGKYYTLATDGALATLVRIGAAAPRAVEVAT